MNNESDVPFAEQQEQNETVAPESPKLFDTEEKLQPQSFLDAVWRMYKQKSSTDNDLPQASDGYQFIWVAGQEGFAVVHICMQGIESGRVLCNCSPMHMGRC